MNVKDGKGISDDKETAGNMRFNILGDLDEARFEGSREKVLTVKEKNYGKKDFHVRVFKARR